METDRLLGLDSRLRSYGAAGRYHDASDDDDEEEAEPVRDEMLLELPGGSDRSRLGAD